MKNEKIKDKSTNKNNPPTVVFGLFLFGAPGGIRTPDNTVRSRGLYPAEIRVQKRDFARAYKLYTLGVIKYSLLFHKCQ